MYSICQKEKEKKKAFAKEAKEETKGFEGTNLFFCHYVPERNLPSRRKSI